MLQSPLFEVLMDLDKIESDLRNVNIALARVSCNLIKIIKTYEIQKKESEEA